MVRRAVSNSGWSAGRGALNMKGAHNEGLPTLQWPWLDR
jgi:hypothetical protein